MCRDDWRSSACRSQRHNDTGLTTKNWLKRPKEVSMACCRRFPHHASISRMLTGGDERAGQRGDKSRKNVDWFLDEEE